MLDALVVVVVVVPSLVDLVAGIFFNAPCWNVLCKINVTSMMNAACIRTWCLLCIQYLVPLRLLLTIAYN